MKLPPAVLLAIPLSGAESAAQRPPAVPASTRER
jgi:hypothetical protein